MSECIDTLRLAIFLPFSLSLSFNYILFSSSIYNMQFFYTDVLVHIFCYKSSKDPILI